MIRGLVILLIGAAIGGSGLFAYYYLTAAPQNGRSTQGPSSNRGSSRRDTGGPSTARRSIMALGTIESRGGIVQVSSALMGYRIKKVHVEEGQLVKPGELLVELESDAAETELQLAKTRESEAVERQASEVAVAKERVAGAELAVKQADEGAALEKEAQKARLTVAELKVRQVDQDLQRLVQLRALKEPLASEQQVQHQRIALEGANAELEAAKVASSKLEQSLKFQQESAAGELRVAKQTLALAERGTGIESLKQGVALAELKLSQTKVSAHAAGMVISITAHAGEVVAQQPLLQLADVDALICVAEIEAADVPFLKPNHKAIIASRAFQNEVLEGTLEHVGNRVSQASLRPVDPRQPVDRSVVKGVIQLDSQKAAERINAGAGDRRSALIGLQVEVEFPLTGQGGTTLRVVREQRRALCHHLTERFDRS